MNDPFRIGRVREEGVHLVAMSARPRPLRGVIAVALLAFLFGFRYARWCDELAAAIGDR